MTVKILHLYHDLMNLYGEYGNVKMLERYLGYAGAEIICDRVTTGEEFDILNYDFVYCGAGTESNQKLAMKDLERYKDKLKQYADCGKTALFTGNSFEMLGDYIKDVNGTTHEGLKIADFHTEETDFRTVRDVICEAPFLDTPVVGFINKCSNVSGNKESLFEIKYGAYKTSDIAEGVRINNVMGTHITGPVLVKNPAFLKYVAGLITDGGIDNVPGMRQADEAYTITLNELMKRFSK